MLERVVVKLRVSKQQINILKTHPAVVENYVKRTDEGQNDILNTSVHI